MQVVWKREQSECGGAMSRFLHDLHAPLAIESEGHAGGTWTAEPEMFYPGLRLGFDRLRRHQSQLRLRRRFNHEYLAFAQINQRRGAGRVGAFRKHACTSFTGIES